MKEKITNGGASEFIKPSSLIKGQTFNDLVYLESKIDQFEKPSHRFKKGDGSLIAFNSAGALDSKIKQLKAGDVVDIVYLGRNKLASGKYKGKEYHDFEVLRESGKPEVKETKKTASF